jgi:hypothetical protein
MYLRYSEKIIRAFWIANARDLAVQATSYFCEIFQNFAFSRLCVMIIEVVYFFA